MSSNFHPPLQFREYLGTNLTDEMALPKKLGPGERYQGSNFRAVYNKIVGLQIQDELSRFTRRREENEIQEAAFLLLDLHADEARYLNLQHAG